MGDSEGRAPESLNRHSVLFEPDAAQDVRGAYVYYSERGAEVAESFLTEVDDPIDLVRAHPTSFPIVYGRMRRIVVNRFPYGVFYKLLDDGIHIVGCIHLHRHPRTWESRA